MHYLAKIISFKLDLIQFSEILSPIHVEFLNLFLILPMESSPFYLPPFTF